MERRSDTSGRCAAPDDDRRGAPFEGLVHRPEEAFDLGPDVVPHAAAGTCLRNAEAKLSSSMSMRKPQRRASAATSLGQLARRAAPAGEEAATPFCGGREGGSHGAPAAIAAELASQLEVEAQGMALVPLRGRTVQPLIVQLVTLAPEGDGQDTSDRRALVREDQSLARTSSRANGGLWGRSPERCAEGRQLAPQLLIVGSGMGVWLGRNKALRTSAWGWARFAR